MGGTKSVAFPQVDKADIDLQGKSVTIYAGGMKFAGISLECTCMANLMKRFEQEGVVVSEGSAAPMTKLRLLWAAIRPLAVVILGIATATLFLLVFMCVFAGLDVRMLAIVPGLLGMIACILAFRRDYIKKITAAKKDSSGTKCIVSSKSGRNHAVYAGEQTLSDLHRWFKTGVREKDAVDMVDDALKAIP